MRRRLMGAAVVVCLGLFGEEQEWVQGRLKGGFAGLPSFSSADGPKARALIR